MSRALSSRVPLSAVAKASITPSNEGAGVFQCADHTVFEALHQRLSDCVDQLLFAGEPSVDAPDGDSGVFGNAGDGELFRSVVDQDVFGRGQ